MLKKARIFVFLALVLPMLLAVSTAYADADANPLLIIYNSIKIGVTDVKEVESAINRLNFNRAITEPLIMSYSNMLDTDWSWTWIDTTYRGKGFAPTARLQITVDKSVPNAFKIQHAKYAYS